MKDLRAIHAPFYQKVGEEYFWGQERNEPGQKVQFQLLGATTIYFTDGKSHFMIDAYLSRPKYPKKPAKPEDALLVSDLAKVRELFDYIGAPPLSHILVTHNHFDHTFDLGALYREVKRSSGTAPVLYGSFSARNAALGQNVPDADIRPVERRYAQFETVRIGDFRVAFLPGVHGKGPTYQQKYNTEVLRQPCGRDDYGEGGVFDLFIEHPAVEPILVSSSFGYGSYDTPAPVKTMMFGMGGCMSKKQVNGIKFWDDYYVNMVQKFAPKLMLGIHWEKYDEPIDQQPEWIYDENDSYELLNYYSIKDHSICIKVLKMLDKVTL